MLAEINKKAQKIREKRVDAANNKSLEAAVFDFFRNIEESRAIHGGVMYDPNLFQQAKKSLEERIRGFDPGGKISVEFNVSEDLKSWEQQQVRGTTIWWSKAYIIRNKVDPSYFIDISQMLFL
jgi:hypothetical protein